MRELTYAEAAIEAIAEEMRRDPKIFYMSTAGFSAEVAAVVTEDAATFARLKAPVRRVCALNVPIPYSPVLEDHVFPDRRRIAEAVRALLASRPARATA